MIRKPHETGAKVIRLKTVSELERLSMSLDEALEVTASMTIAEIDAGLREMGIDPHTLPPLSLSRVLSRRNESKGAAYAYVSDELLRGECAGDVRLLMLRLRFLARHERYGEALELARQATLLAPRYWRAWISYGSLLSLSGSVDEGEAIFRRTREDFSFDPKAAAAALHGCAFAREDRGGFSLSQADAQEVLRMYEEAVELDGSRANTRACLVINTVLSRGFDEELFEDSLLCEGFFDAVSLELREREARGFGAQMYEVVRTFPAWCRNLLGGAGAGRFEGADAGFAY